MIVQCGSQFTTAKVPHKNISMVSVCQTYVVTQKVHIEGATNSTLLDFNSATQIMEIKESGQAMKKKETSID